MLSAIIATHDSERALVPTLAALVPGATAGLITEVIVADAGSRDATAEVADYAGCRFIVASGPLGARLRTAAVTARAPWLMFLRAGTVPEPGWMNETERFIAGADTEQAAVFRKRRPLRPQIGELGSFLFAHLWGTRGEGLIVAKAFYEQLGGHRDHAEAEAALLRRIGRRRLIVLPCAAAAR